MIEYSLSFVLTTLLYLSASLYLSLIITDTLVIPQNISIIMTGLSIIIPAFLSTLLLDRIFKEVPDEGKDKKSILMVSFFKELNCKFKFWDTEYPTLFHYKSLFGKTTVLVSKGLLKSLSEKELQEVAGYEKTKLRSGRTFLLHIISFFPFCIRHISSFLFALGINHKAVGGAGSIISFSAILSYISKILYIFIFFFSRSSLRFCYRKHSLMHETTKKISELRKNIQTDSRTYELIASLSFLDIIEYKNTLYVSRGYKLCDYSNSGWNDYFELYRAHPLENRGGGKPSPENRKSYLLFLAIILLSLLSLLLLTCNISPWFISLPLSILLISLHLSQYSFRKPQYTLYELIGKTEILKGFPLKIKGRAELYEQQIAFENTAYLATESLNLPLRFTSLSKPALQDDEGYTELSGWLRFGEEIYIEVASLSMNKKTIFRANPLYNRLIADIFIFMISLLMIIFKFKEG